MIISLSSKIVKKEKPVKIPKSIAFAAEKTKSRIVKAVPGRYILKNRKGMFVVVRFKEETRYTASVGTKLFSASSTEHAVEDYFTVESESNQPGARNSAAGNKLGKKNHAKGMMAAGWWLFAKRADGKMQKAYIGGRISGRRLLGLLDPSTVKTEAPKKEVAKTKKLKVTKLNGKNLYSLTVNGKDAATLSATQKATNLKTLQKLGLTDPEIKQVLEQVKPESNAKPKAEPNVKPESETKPVKQTKSSSPDEMIAKLPLLKKNYAEHIIETHLKDVKYYSSAKAKKDLDEMRDSLNQMRRRDTELQGQSDHLKDNIDILEMKIRTQQSKIEKFAEEGKLYKKDPESYTTRTKVHALDWTKRAGMDLSGMIRANEGKVPEAKIKALRAELKTRKKIGAKPDLTNLTYNTRQEQAYKESKAKRSKNEVKFGKR